MFASFTPRIATAVGVGLAVGIASTATAADKPRPVTIPSSVFKTDESRLCMPTPGVRNAKTECLTRADWEAKGVTFRIK